MFLDNKFSVGRSKGKEMYFISIKCTWGVKSALLSNNNALWHLIQNLLKYMQLCIEYSHLCKQHHLECVKIPEIVNNSMQLGVSFYFISRCFAVANYLAIL